MCLVRSEHDTIAPVMHGQQDNCDTLLRHFCSVRRKSQFTQHTSALAYTLMQCDETLSLSLFFAAVAKASPAVLGVLGSGCSVASKAVAQIVHYWSVSQVRKIS